MVSVMFIWKLGAMASEQAAMACRALSGRVPLQPTNQQAGQWSCATFQNHSDSIGL